jgi:hypothetical protein
VRHPSRRLAVVVLPLACCGAFATSADARTRKPTCEVGDQWTSSLPGFVETDREELKNFDRAPATLDFTTSQSGTVEVSASASVEVETSAGFGAFSAGVKAQLGVTASRSVTVEKGIALHVIAAGRRRVVVRFGATTRRLRGWRVVDPDNLQDLDILLEGIPLKRVPGMPASCPLRAAEPISAVVPIGTGHTKRSYALRKRS